MFRQSHRLLAYALVRRNRVTLVLHTHGHWRHFTKCGAAAWVLSWGGFRARLPHIKPPARLGGGKVTNRTNFRNVGEYHLAHDTTHEGNQRVTILMSPYIVWFVANITQFIGSWQRIQDRLCRTFRVVAFPDRSANNNVVSPCLNC